MKSKIVSLSKNEEFKSILGGKKISNKYLTIFFKKLSDKNNKKLNISFVAKKKIGNAVSRNKIKRRLKNIMNDVDSANKKGMIQKPDKPVSFSPCGWCGIYNPESAFASEKRLTELYSTGYSADKVPEAVRLAMDFKAKDNEAKIDILQKQCEKLCYMYNELEREKLSHLV